MRTSEAGRLPTRLMAFGHSQAHYYLSDELLCERWVANPYYQFFCGEEFFQHCLAFDRSSLTRWRQRMGTRRSCKHCSRRALRSPPRPRRSKPSDLYRVIIDATVQPKNVMLPTNARLLNRARETLVRLDMLARGSRRL